MDALAALLDGPRARDAFLLRSLLHPPWSLRIQDEAPLTLVAVVRGSAWIVPDQADPLDLGPGDLAILRGPEPYTVSDDPATAPQVIVHPGQRCTTAEGEVLTHMSDLGVRTWGNDPDGPTILLTGTYQISGEISERLLGALPATLVVPGRSGDSPLIGLLNEEIAKDAAGQDAVLDRLLDLLLIATLRTWLDRADTDAPRWYRAHRDPIVGRALRMMHHNPAHPWTVAKLAAEIGTSRAALSRRFHDLVGEPPITFLTGWRLALAADLLRDTDTTISAVADQVGYASPFALSAAFKRVRGVSPREYRIRPPELAASQA